MRNPSFRAWLPNLLAISLGAGALGLTACVTVNVNFPESAVQKATDDYVRDLYRAKETRKSGAPDSAAPAATKPQAHGFALPILIASAQAGDAFGEEEAFKVSTPRALAIRDKLAGHLSDVLEHKRAGVLGETNDGLLEIREPGKLKKLLARKVEKLVADENADRLDLYREVVKANGLPEARIKNVQKSFARSFQAESPSGTWMQDVDGKWAQKP